MGLKKFDDYLTGLSTDPSVFEKKIIFASKENNCSFFKIISEESEIYNESNTYPVVIWGDFKFTPKIINENRFSLYNINDVPRLDEIYESFSGEKFVPVSITDRKKIAGLKFPIIASNDFEKKKFKTYYSFKKSENEFKRFTESPKIENTFETLVFKKEPIHLQENIKGVSFDINLSNFKFLNEIKNIVESISNKYVLDLYKLKLGESRDGKLYLLDISRSGSLTPTQKLKAYESIYESHYERKLPVWYKKSLLENTVTNYYRKSYYDSLLLKPKYSIDFKKFAVK